MSDPITVDIPHKLGKAGAKARMESEVGRLSGKIPAGRVTEHRWEGDTMIVVVEALGQRVTSRMEVRETSIHAVFELPPLLAMFAGAIKGRLERDGTKLLK